MTKREFIKSLQDRTGLGSSDAREVVELIFSHIKQELLLGHAVRIEGVGVLKLKHYEPRTMINNVSGIEYEVPERIKVKFRMAPSMGRSLKRELLEG